MADNPWSDYDFLQVNAEENPIETLAPMIAKCPVGHSDVHGGFYIVNSHADCMAAARDPHLTSRPEEGPGPGFPYAYDLLRMPMITDDGPRHRDFRLPLQKLFSPAFAESQRGTIVAICDKLIDQFIESGTGDLADGFSIELPAVLISELLALPEERRREFQHWACDAVAKGDMDAFRNVADYTAELYRLHSARRDKDSIPGQIFDFAIDGRPITVEEWRGIVLLLIMGGLDTTANAGGYIFHMIATRPGLRDYLLEDMSRIPRAVPEFVRMISPVPQHSRGVTADTEIGGQPLRKGDVVEINWYAANHDPAAFPDPEKFDPDRKLGHHLGFGFGPHLCLGRHLAVVELEVMIERVLTRLPDYRLTPGGTVRFPGINRGMSHLKVDFTPGPKLSA